MLHNRRIRRQVCAVFGCDHNPTILALWHSTAAEQATGYYRIFVSRTSTSTRAVAGSTAATTTKPSTAAAAATAVTEHGSAAAATSETKAACRHACLISVLSTAVTTVSTYSAIEPSCRSIDMITTRFPNIITTIRGATSSMLTV